MNEGFLPTAAGAILQMVAQGLRAKFDEDDFLERLQQSKRTCTRIVKGLHSVSKQLTHSPAHLIDLSQFGHADAIRGIWMSMVNDMGFVRATPLPVRSADMCTLIRSIQLISADERVFFHLDGLALYLWRQLFQPTNRFPDSFVRLPLPVLSAGFLRDRCQLKLRLHIDARVLDRLSRESCPRVLTAAMEQLRLPDWVLAVTATYVSALTVELAAETVHVSENQLLQALRDDVQEAVLTEFQMHTEQLDHRVASHSVALPFTTHLLQLIVVVQHPTQPWFFGCDGDACKSPLLRLRLFLDDHCRADYDARTAWYLDKHVHNMHVPSVPIYTITLGDRCSDGLDTRALRYMRLDIELDHGIEPHSRLVVLAVGRNVLRQMGRMIGLALSE